MQFPLITYSMALNLLTTVHRQNFNTEKICVQILLCERVERASLENFRIIYILNLLFLSIFCWYFRYFVGLQVPTISKCTNHANKTPKKQPGGGGGGGASHYASVVFCRKSMTFVLIQFLVHYSLSWPIMTLSTPCKLPENSEKIYVCERAERASLENFRISTFKNWSLKF